MPFTGNATCNVFKLGLINGQFNFDGSQSYKIALYNNTATLDADTTVYTAAGEISGSGYVAGGSLLTPTEGIEDGVAYVTFADVTWSGAFTVRGALIYQVSGGAAVCVLDFGSDKVSQNTFTVEFPVAGATTGLIRLS
jgi:hypothetical protein